MGPFALMIDMTQKLLLFPVETISRELDFKLVLAGYCADKGRQIFLGNHTDIYELGRQVKHGLYVGKNLLNVSPRRLTECYEDLKRNRFRVVHLDEEGAIFSGDEPMWKEELVRKFDPGWLEAEDYACAWGEFQAEVYRELKPACAEHIRVTGHPRFNLCHERFLPLYEEETGRLREAYGRFILVNTNFTRGNFGTEPDYFFKRYKVKAEDRELRGMLVEEFAYTQQKVALYIRMLNRLSDEFADCRIILRPHPSEGVRLYEAILKYVPRAEVCSEGGLIAWLRAAECLIHCGCTTGIEGWLCGVPVFNYQPLFDGRFEKEIPNLVGKTVGDEEALVGGVRQVLAGGEAPAGVEGADLEKIRRLFCHLGDSTEAFEGMAKLVSEVLEEVGLPELTGSLGGFVRRGYFEKAKGFVRGFLPEGLRFESGNLYRKRRFPGLNREGILKKLEFVERLTGRRLKARFYSSKLMSVMSE